MQVEDYDKLLKQTYRTAPIGLCLFDTELRYWHINEWLAEINGLSVERHLGRSISEVLPDVAAGVEAQLRRVIETGKPVVGGTVEAETATEPGVKKHFEHHYQAVRTPDGAIVGVSCVVQDVTERKQAEEALRVKTDQLGAVSDAMIAFLDSGNWREASATILRSALDQTSSQYGFVGVVAAGSTLRILAHDGIEWDKVIGRELYDQALRHYDSVGYLEFTSFENLFGKVITSGRAVVSNDPPNDPRSAGRPPGHPPLRHFLGVPIFKGSEVVGMIGVANRPGGYMGTEQEKIEILCRAAGVLYDSYRRQQYEGALEQKRKRTEEALVEARNELEERVKARTAELTQSELRHRVLLESTNAVPWEADCTTWQFTYVGPQATKLLGYPPQRWLDIDFWTSHIHPEDRMFALDYCLRSAKSKVNYDFEYRMITADGRTVWIHDIVNVESEAGEPKTLRGFMIDITERKQAEEALRVSATRLQLATDAARIGHWNWDIRTNEVYFSREWKRQLGYEDHEIPNLFEEWESRLHPDDLQQTIKNVEDYVAGRKANHVAEFRLRHKDGSYRWIYTRAEKQVDETGKACRLFGCHIDITDRKRAEEKLRKNRDDMRELARRLITAHEDERRRIARELHDDLSQRLASIVIDSSMLESEIRPITESGADKLAKLSDRIRETSVDVHQVSRQLHPSILDELGLVKALQAECNAFQRRSGIALRFERPSEYSSVAKSTELALYRIMQECLRNIEKHSRAVSACVTLHVNEAQVSLTVTDTGTGFDPTQQREEPGLGMASLKERAGLLGGTVSIQSEIGRGTTVTAQLPAKTRES